MTEVFVEQPLALPGSANKCIHYNQMGCIKNGRWQLGSDTVQSGEMTFSRNRAVLGNIKQCSVFTVLFLPYSVV